MWTIEVKYDNNEREYFQAENRTHARNCAKHLRNVWGKQGSQLVVSAKVVGPLGQRG